MPSPKVIVKITDRNYKETKKTFKEDLQGLLKML